MSSLTRVRSDCGSDIPAIASLVSCPGDFVRSDPSFGIGVGPAEGSCRLGVGADVFPQLLAQICHRGEYAARNHVPLKGTSGPLWISLEADPLRRPRRNMVQSTCRRTKRL
jgi:hypothetical protein